MPQSAAFGLAVTAAVEPVAGHLAEEAGIGALPHRCARAASDRSRPGLSPAVTSKLAAMSTPTPDTVSSCPGVAVTSSASSASMCAFSSSGASTRRPRILRAVI